MLTVTAVLLFILLGLVPYAGYYKILTVLSGSMVPAMPKGALVVVLPEALNEVRPGDIITYYLPNNQTSLETHRVKKILQSGSNPIIQTKGDANQQPDPWRLRLLTQPAWKVWLILPGFGYVLEWLRLSGMQFLATAIAPLILGVIWLRDVWISKDYHAVISKKLRRLGGR